MRLREETLFPRITWALMQGTHDRNRLGRLEHGACSWHGQTRNPTP